jgi:hypothetical protein
MDYASFLMDCVDDYWNSQDYDDFGEQDSMIIDIECVNIINHHDQSCASFIHCNC